MDTYSLEDNRYHESHRGDLFLILEEVVIPNTEAGTRGGLKNMLLLYLRHPTDRNFELSLQCFYKDHVFSAHPLPRGIRGNSHQALKKMGRGQRIKYRDLA